MYSHRLKTTLLTCVLLISALSLTSISYAQSTSLPRFTDPYANVGASLQADGPAATTVPPAKKPSHKAADRRDGKHDGKPRQKIGDAAHAGSKVAGKKITPETGSAVPTSYLGSSQTSHLSVAHPGNPAPAADGPLGFDFKWSAANSPSYNPATSTIPGVDEVKRNTNDTPVETGSSVEAGVKLKF
jgi:hypothetical protein